LKAVVLAAGKGTRLATVDPGLPKVLHRIGERPCIEYILAGMAKYGIDRVLLVIGYRGDLIQEAIGCGSHLGLAVEYAEQDMSRYGTGAAVQMAEPFAGGEPFLFSFGDILVYPRNYQYLCDAYGSTGCPTIGVNWTEDPKDGAAVYVDDENRVLDIIEKPEPGTSATHWNQAGVSVFTAGIFDYLRDLKPSARGEYELTHAVQRMLAAGERVLAYPLEGYWQDIGSPEDLARVQAMAERGMLGL